MKFSMCIKGIIYERWTDLCSRECSKKGSKKNLRIKVRILSGRQVTKATGIDFIRGRHVTTRIKVDIGEIAGKIWKSKNTLITIQLTIHTIDLRDLMTMIMIKIWSTTQFLPMTL